MEYWKNEPQITSFQKKLIAEFASFSKLLRKTQVSFKRLGTGLPFAQL